MRRSNKGYGTILCDRPRFRAWCEQARAWVIDELPDNLLISIHTDRTRFNGKARGDTVNGIAAWAKVNGVHFADIGIFATGKKGFQRIFIHELIHILLGFPRIRQQFITDYQDMSELAETLRPRVDACYAKPERKEELLVWTLTINLSAINRLC